MIFETLAIVTYLDEAFDGPALQSDDLTARAKMRLWMKMKPLRRIFLPRLVRAIPRDRTPTTEELATARDALANAERLTSGDGYVVGASVTLADLYLAPQIANCAEKAPALLDEHDGAGRDADAMRGGRATERSAQHGSRHLSPAPSANPNP